MLVPLFLLMEIKMEIYSNEIEDDCPSCIYFINLERYCDPPNWLPYDYDVMSSFGNYCPKWKGTNHFRETKEE